MQPQRLAPIGSAHIAHKQQHPGTVQEIDVRPLRHAQRQDGVHEIEQLVPLRHPHVLEYKLAFAYNGKLCVVTEHAPRGDLSSVLQLVSAQGTLVPEAMVWGVFIQVARGLQVGLPNLDFLESCLLLGVLSASWRVACFLLLGVLPAS